MRILLVHNYYQQRGGEDAVFEAEADLLEGRGHQVCRHTFHNREISAEGGPFSRLKLAGTTVWSRGAASRIRACIQHFRPDIAHFHNTFPLISPAAFAACQAEQVPVVNTLHNFRLLCSNAQFFRDNQVCEDCLGRVFGWPGIWHACYRNSHKMSAVVATMQSVGWLRGSWTRHVNRFIALSDFGRRKFEQGGLPTELIAVKPNFLDPDPGYRPGGGGYALYVGRLTAEKGIEVLLDAWRQFDCGMPLHIFGDGPMAREVQAASEEREDILWFGSRSLPEVLESMGNAEVLVVPSLWYEGMPRTIIESLSVGTPVIASRVGSVPETITNRQSGMLFETGNSSALASAVKEVLMRDTTVSRESARNEYLSRFTADINYHQLIDIYDAVLGIQK
jgi:glycosyltransferase involved in cell wall biosynthesis